MSPLLRAIIPFVLLAMPAAAEQLQKWITFPTTQKRYASVEVDLQRSALSVISTSRVLSARGGADPTVERIGPLIESKTRDFVLTSGGLYRLNPLDAAGLLVADGLILAPLALSPGRRNEVAGVLCISDRGRPSILTIDEYRAQRAACSGAIQAGPILVLDRDPELAKMPAPDQDTSQTARLVACTSKKSSERFIIYYFESSNMALVKESLESECSSAINLSGSVQAGISVWHGGLMVDSVGRTDSPVPSMILATPLRRGH